jgi:hypothetical protein
VEAKLVQVNHVNALKHFQIIMEAGRQQRQNERSDALAFVAKKGVQSQGESEEQGVVVQQMAGDAAKGRQQQAQSESSPPKEKTRPKPRPRIETHRIITANMVSSTICDITHYAHSCTAFKDNVRTTHDTQGVGITGSYTVWMKDIAKTCEKSHNTAGPVGTADLSTLVQTWKVLRQCDSAAAQACQQFIRALLAEPEGDLFADAK